MSRVLLNSWMKFTQPTLILIPLHVFDCCYKLYALKKIKQLWLVVNIRD